MTVRLASDFDTYSNDALSTVDQWSFLKTGTTESLASHAEIDVWVQAPEALL